MIGLHALEVAKVAWNSVISSDLPSAASVEACRTVTDLLKLCRRVLWISMRDGVQDAATPWDEVEVLEEMIRREAASNGIL